MGSRYWTKLYCYFRNCSPPAIGPGPSRFGWGVAALWLLFCLGAQAQSVRITWIGQACFLVQSEGGPTVVADPPAANLGYALPATAADAVFVTHNHGDHNNTAGVRGNPTLVDGRPTTARTEMSAASLPFVLIPGFHDNQNGAVRGPNTIIQWTQSGLRFAHFGDYGQDQLSDAQRADLRDLDVLFVPAGGFFTPEPPQIAALASQLRARVTILMHYRTALGGPAQVAGLPAVSDPFGGIVYKPASVILSRDRLPAAPEVWLMEVAAEGAVVNAGSFNAGAPVAPGSVASVFGTFTGSQTLAASDVPLARRLGATDVVVQESTVPLYYVSPTQINFQVPGQLRPGQYPVDVRVNGQRVARVPVSVVPRAPGLFAALNQDGRLNSTTAAARRGEVLQIFATGQGEVSPAVDDGARAPSTPLALTTGLPEVTIGGRPASVRFTGLAPGFVGVWQINAAIPADAPVGTAVPLIVTFGRVSNTLSLAIQ